MKRISMILFLSIVICLSMTKLVYAAEVSPTPIPTESPDYIEDTIIISLTPEEKQMYLDSIQVIRAILVFFLVCLVFYAIISFLGWFF